MRLIDTSQLQRYQEWGLLIQASYKDIKSQDLLIQVLTGTLYYIHSTGMVSLHLFLHVSAASGGVHC